MSNNWPNRSNIGTFVTTAGLIDLDDESCRTRHLDQIPTATLPRGFRLILRDIDPSEMAWLYHDRFGVLYLPQQLFLPWS